MDRQLWFLAALVVMISYGCDDSVEVSCLDFAVPGITVDMIDGRTNGPPSPQQFFGVATDGEFTDSVAGYPADGRFGFAYERPGIYDVRLWGDTYRVWTAEAVRVTQGKCHVNTVELVARLEPSDTVGP
jgi:hypothetical protein